VLFVLIVLGLISSGAIAQTVTPATGGQNISADNFATGTWTTLGNITIAETAPGQLSAGTIRLRVPSGFIWDSATTPTITINSSKAQRITVVGGSVSINSQDFEFAITGSSSGQPPNNTHSITIANLRVRPAQGSPLSSGQIQNLGSAAPGGTTNYGSISSVAGADNRIRVETEANGSGIVVAEQDLEAGQSITAYSIVRDQFNNFKRNEAANWSLQNLTGGVTGGNLVPAGDNRSAVLTGNLIGSATIRATFGALTVINSDVVTVVPSDPSNLVITTQPSATVTAGVPFAQQPVVAIRDAFGNNIIGDNGSIITATREDGTGTLQGTTGITVSQGVATFTNLFHTVADDITVQFSADDLSSVFSNNIVVSPAAADSLIFTTQPTNGNRNNNLNPAPVIQLIDEYGNFVPQSGVDVTMQLESGTGNLQGTPTVQTTVDGEAIFSAIRFNQDGTKTIKATSTGLKDSAPSNSFNIAEQNKFVGFAIENTSGGNIATQIAGDVFNIRIRAVDGSGTTMDGGGPRDNFEGFVNLTTTGLFSSGSDTVNVGPFVNGVFTPHPLTIISSGNTSITATNTAGAESGTSNTFLINPFDADIDNSFLSVSIDTLIADGMSESEVTLQLVDEFGNHLTSDISETVLIFIASGDGSISTTTANGDGTYSATFTAPDDVGTTTIGASIDSQNITTGNAEIIATFGELTTFLVEAASGGNIGTQTAGNAFNIRITALDNFDNIVESFDGSGSTVQITSTGNLTAGFGTTATFANGILNSHSVTINNTGNFNITARKTGFPEEGTSNTFTVSAAAADPSTSLITTARPFLESNGTDNTIVTVQLRDQFLNNLSSGGDAVTLATTAGSLSSVSDNGNGTYTATLTASGTPATATITGTVNSVSITDNAVVVITQVNRWTANAGGQPANKNQWHNTGNWSLGSLPTTGQIVEIPTGVSNYPVITINDPVLDFLIIESGASVTLDGRNLTINNEISGDGSFLGNNGIITINGNSELSNFIAGSSDITFSGSSTQSISGDFTGNTISLDQDVNVEGYLEAFDVFTIETGSTLTMMPGSELFIVGDIIIDGALIGNNSTFSFGGDIIGTNITLTNTSIEFNGTTEQQINAFAELNNLIINNPAGVVLNNDFVVSGTLTLTSGFLTVSSGSNLIANNKAGNTDNIRMLREVNGSPGWRLLSSPLNTTIGNFLDETDTQGFTGASIAGNLQPNVLWYQESATGTDLQRWRAPGNATDNISAGRGYFVYFFGNDPLDANYNTDLPVTLDADGAEFEGDGTRVSLPVTYTAAADTGWNLVGNPFAATVDWDDGTWTKTNMTNSIYIWDDSTNEYRSWNGITGSLGTGEIAPFQGFWVKANGNGVPVLRVNKSSKTTGGVFYKTVNEDIPKMGIRMEANGMAHSTHFSFTPDGSNAIDDFDAYRLLPFDNLSHLQIYSVLNDGTELTINNLPRKFGLPLEIPIYVNGIEEGYPFNGSATLSWADLEVPDSWTLTIIDNETGTEINIRDQQTYDFNLQSKGKAAPVHAYSPNEVNLVQKQPEKARNARFTLIIEPGEDASELPVAVELRQNFPNPFNPTTTIRYALPLENRVKLEVFDILGRKIKTLVDGRIQAGYHTVQLDAKDLASGVYIYRLATENTVRVQKMTLIK
jgi:hypothetical protein